MANPNPPNIILNIKTQKSLTRSDLQRFLIRDEMYEHLFDEQEREGVNGGGKLTVNVVDEYRNSYPFIVNPKKTKDGRFHKYRTFINGWHPFVRRHNLKSGCVLEFAKGDDEARYLTVRVIHRTADAPLPPLLADAPLPPLLADAPLPPLLAIAPAAAPIAAPDPLWLTLALSSTAAGTSNPTQNSRKTDAPSANQATTDTNEKGVYDEQITELKLSAVEKERDFYFSKLRDIGMICQKPEIKHNPVVEAIQKILDAVDDNPSVMEEAQTLLPEHHTESLTPVTDEKDNLDVDVAANTILSPRQRLSDVSDVHHSESPPVLTS